MFFLGLGVLFVVGESMVTFAQGFLVMGLVVLLIDLLEWALPGKLLPRPVAATLGEDGVQMPEGFLGWHRFRQIREVVRMETAEERRRRMQQKQIARHPWRLRYVIFDLHKESPDWPKHAAYPRDVRGFIEEANERLARRREPTAEVDGDYRSTAELVHVHPRNATLDTALPSPERVAAFLLLSVADRRAVLDAMADDEGREVFKRRGAAGA